MFFYIYATHSVLETFCASALYKLIVYCIVLYCIVFCGILEQAIFNYIHLV